MLGTDSQERRYVYSYYLVKSSGGWKRERKESEKTFRFLDGRRWRGKWWCHLERQEVQ